MPAILTIDWWKYLWYTDVKVEGLTKGLLAASDVVVARTVRGKRENEDARLMMVMMMLVLANYMS